MKEVDKKATKKTVGGSPNSPVKKSYSAKSYSMHGYKGKAQTTRSRESLYNSRLKTPNGSTSTKSNHIHTKLFYYSKKIFRRDF